MEKDRKTVHRRPAPAGAGQNPPRPPRRTPPKSQRRRAVLLCAVCVLAVLLTIVIVVVAGRDRGPKEPAVPDVGNAAGAWAKNENGFYFNDAGQVILPAVKKGIDVSKYQGEVDWEKAQAAGIDFAILRCGFGSEWNGEGEYAQDDETWERNADECTRLGIPFGAYLYSYATTEEQARSEADHVARLLGLKAPDHEGLTDYTSKAYKLDYPVYYDLEDKAITGLFPDEMAKLTAAFFDQLEKWGYTGEQGVYASLNWTRGRLMDAGFDEWRDNFWIARFSSDLGYTGPYTMWQASYTEPGADYGVQSETVDIDFVMEELLLTGITDAKTAAAQPSFTNDTYTNELWLGTAKDKVTLTTDEVTEEEGGQRVFWTSSDENVATVNKKGVVTAKGDGTCTVTATLADGRQSAAVTVRVGEVSVPVYATGNLRGVTDNGTVTLADVAALASGTDAILLDAGGSVQGTANTSLTGGMDMTSSFAAAGYDLQAFDGVDLAFGAERLLDDVVTANGPSLAANLRSTEGAPLFYRSTCWSRNRISNGMNYTVQRAGKTIGFFSLASTGNYAHAAGMSADDLAQTASEQVAALKSAGAQAILCIAGPDTDVTPILNDLKTLGVNAVISANAAGTDASGSLPVIAVNSGLDSVGSLELVFDARGGVSVRNPQTLPAATLQANRETLSEEARTVYDSTTESLAKLTAGDAEVAGQTLFTFEKGKKTISFGNYVAEVYLAYADGDRDNWQSLEDGLADLPLTAVAGGVTQPEYGEITRGTLLNSLPAGQRVQLVKTTAEAVAQLLDSGTVTQTYADSLVGYEAEGDALLVTDTGTLRTLSDQNYTVLRDYGDVFWDVRMNINDRTNNFAESFVLPDAPAYGAGRVS